MSNDKTLKIIQGISQAAARSFDGAVDEDGKPIKMGLKREQGHVVNQSRNVDGFKVRINADILIVTYQSEIRLKDVHDPRFENEQVLVMDGALKWLKSEYNKITGDTLSLKSTSEPKVNVQSMSRVRSWVIVTCAYKINGMDVDTSSTYENTSGTDAFNKLGGWNK